MKNPYVNVTGTEIARGARVDRGIRSTDIFSLISTVDSPVRVNLSPAMFIARKTQIPLVVSRLSRARFRPH